MNFLKKIFSKSNKSTAQTPGVQKPNQLPMNGNEQDPFRDDYVRLGIAKPAGQEEKELVSIITSAIMAGDNPDTHFKIKNVYAIDENKEVAAVVAAAVAAGDKPNSHIRLKSVVEL